MKLLFFLLFHKPGAVGKEEHTRAVEQSILKLARVAGPVLELELANAVSPTCKDTLLAVSRDARSGAELRGGQTIVSNSYTTVSRLVFVDWYAVFSSNEANMCMYLRCIWIPKLMIGLGFVCGGNKNLEKM